MILASDEKGRSKQTKNLQRKKKKKRAIFMPPIEYVTPEGFRIDGRKPNEVCLLCVMGIFSLWLAQHRKVNIKFGVVPNCEASVEFSMGNTTAIAIVHGPRQVRRSLHSFLLLSPFSFLFLL